MTRRKTVMLSGSSLFMWVSAAAAQTAPLPAKEVVASSPDDIIVTARRREESLQDVPQTVNAVNGNALEKLNIKKFDDVQAVVPGLSLSSGGNGYTTAATMRGASFQVESGATPTVEFYLNDALVQSIFVFQSMFDVGQIEVLKGPQGTLRGRASPSGSITVTTRQPDLYKVGGYIDATGTSKGSINANAGFNLPIINDVLALRVAGTVDENDYNFVKSINNGTNPYVHTWAGRASLRFEPTDSLSANVMFQHLNRNQKSFTQVESFSIANPDVPVSTVDPLIRASDRRGITDGANTNIIKQNVVTGKLNWRFAGQQLTYVGSYSKQDLTAQDPSDFGNVFKNYEFYQHLDSANRQFTHELRLSSDTRLFDMFDYTVGVFNSDFKVQNHVVNNTAITIFGTPLFVVPTQIVTDGRQKETSFFANLNWHIGDSTELSGGVRHIIFKSTDDLIISGVNAFSDRKKDTPTVYNFSLSHRFSDHLLAYANTGSSWRGGPYIIGFFRPPTPRLTEFTSLKPETSKSYEIGIKSDFFDRRVRFDVAVFHQDFKNFIYRGSSVNYVNVSNGVELPAIGNFGANVPARIDGVDVDASFRLDSHFNLGAAFSYAKGKIKSGTIACNDLNGDGIPDATAGNPTVAQIKAGAGGEAVAACKVSDRLSFAPDWSFTLTPEYSVPLSSGSNAFLRSLISYYAKNPNDPRNAYDDVPAYVLANLYLGVRSPDGGWEISAFVKNITDTGVVLQNAGQFLATNVQALQPPTFQTTAGASLPSSYTTIGYTPPREFGLNVRFAFGSR